MLMIEMHDAQEGRPYQRETRALKPSLDLGGLPYEMSSPDLATTIETSLSGLMGGEFCIS